MLMDRMGRIPLMRFGTLGAIVGLLITSYALYTQATGYFSLFGIAFFIVFYVLLWAVRT